MARWSVDDYSEQTIVNGGNTSISLHSHTDGYDPYFGFNSWASGDATQNVNAFFNNEGDFEASLRSSVRGNQGSYGPEFNHNYSEYSLEFNINSAADINFKNYFYSEMWLTDLTFSLFDKSRNNFVVKDPSIYVLDDISCLKPHYSLLAGDYKLYLMLDSFVGGDNGQNSGGDINLEFSISAAPIPEPSTFFLFGAGLAGLACWRKKPKLTSLSK